MNDLDVALAASRAGAAIIRERFGTAFRTDWKGDVDPVTEVDQLAEHAILSVIRAHRPEDRVLAEESGGDDWDRGRVWIVDPLDGTVNFVHGFPQVSTSVALRHDGIGVVGVVESVVNHETFAAEAGAGATLDGRPISVSTIDEAGRALVGTGFAYDRQRRAQSMADTLAGVLQRFQGIRRVGSAALDLCWVAAGRMDAYWEFGVKPWDTAAGALIVEEAGGRISTFTGDAYPLDDPGIVATNGLVHRALLQAISE
ncbi:MAG: inositol monophosphatase [Acidimicrobiia bacterium]|nr:inositol monophosphatase [Acidimicrobiia bacterium]